MIRYLFRKDEEQGLGNKAEWECSKYFEIMDVLGRGKYATVYRVRRRSDGQLYSLKVTDMTPLSAKARQDVVNEIRLLSSLDHPNLLRYYEAFCDNHQLMLVTEIMGGGDLGTLIDKRAESGELLSERQVWCYFIQIALGLRYLHHSHILHRDIKPQNILIGDDGTLKLADLGVSKVLDAVFTRALIGTPHYLSPGLASVLAPIGTPYYLSPEQWLRKPYSFSADVWALGCVLHELCTLHPLFAGRTNEKVKGKVLRGEVPPLPAQYSFELWELVRRMLDPDPASRPTMDEILELPVVQAHAKDLPIHLQPLLDLELENSQHRRARLLRPVAVPCAPSNWELLNVYLPAARYPTGPGMVDALRMRHSRSCPQLAEELGGEGAGVEGGAGGCTVSWDSLVSRHSSVVLESLEPKSQQQGKQAKQPAFGTFPPPAVVAGELMAEGMEGYEQSGGAKLQRRKTTAGGHQRSGGMRRTPSAATAGDLLRCHTLAVVDLAPRQHSTHSTGDGKVAAGGGKATVGLQHVQQAQQAAATLDPAVAGGGDKGGAGVNVAAPGGVMAEGAGWAGQAGAWGPSAGEKGGEGRAGSIQGKLTNISTSSGKGSTGGRQDSVRQARGGLLDFLLCKCNS